MSLLACTPSPLDTVELTGATMGTRYSVQLPRHLTPTQRQILQQTVELELARMNALLSQWHEDSEISRFNRWSGDGWFPVSPHLAKVVALGLEIGERSGGALDITIAPLVNAWGFGPDGADDSTPSEANIAASQAEVGWRRVRVRTAPPALAKRSSDVTLDISAVAKGYAVDHLVDVVESLGYHDTLVEIGGELAARGAGPGGRPWRVGIEDPVRGGPAHTLALRDAAVATSGDYRNYRIVDGHRQSHLIDPRSGRPIAHGLASVTVVCDTTARADAWATALAILGREAGLALAEREHLSAWFAERRIDDQGTAVVEEYATATMRRRLSIE